MPTCSKSRVKPLTCAYTHTLTNSNEGVQTFSPEPKVYGRKFFYAVNALTTMFVKQMHM